MDLSQMPANLPSKGRKEAGDFVATRRLVCSVLTIDTSGSLFGSALSVIEIAVEGLLDQPVKGVIG